MWHVMKCTGMRFTSVCVILDPLKCWHYGISSCSSSIDDDSFNGLSLFSLVYLWYGAGLT